MITYLAQISDAENPTIFPFPFEMHIALAVISVIFFSYRFAVQKKPFQLIFAIAVPLSLLLWISNNKTLFYTVGIVELILILIAFFTSIFVKPKTAGENTSSDKKDKED
jgi:bacteriorhodopsin